MSYYMAFPLINQDDEYQYQQGFGYPNVGVIEISDAVYKDISSMNDILLNRSIPAIEFETDHLKEMIAFDGDLSSLRLNGREPDSFTVSNPVDFEDNDYTIEFYKAGEIDLSGVVNRVRMNRPKLKLTGRCFSVEATLSSTNEGFTSPSKPLKGMSNYFNTKVYQ